MKKNLFISFVFVCIAFLSIALRLYRVDAPIADWHSFRQSDTASVAKLFVVNGIDFLHPRYHDLSNIQSGKDNPNGYRMVEFPLYQGTAAWLRQSFGLLPIEIWLRILTLLASTATAILLGIWVKNRVSTLAGIFTAISYAVIPYSIFYGRSILPDPIMVFFAISSLTVLDSFGKNNQSISIPKILIASILGALSMLVKPYAVFLLISALPIIISKKQSILKSIACLLIFGIISIIPFYLWRLWIVQFPEGIPASEWLLNGNGIRLKGSWFQWLFAERIGKLLLGYWGLIPFGIGIIASLGKKEGWVFRTLAVGSLLYLIVVASGNVQHDYYQILLLPVIAMYLGKGFARMVERIDVSMHQKKSEKTTSPFVMVGMMIVCFFFMEMFGWYTIRTYYWINHPEIIEAGNAADMILPKDAKVIAAYNGDTTLLYQTNRTGWPLNFDIDKKIAMGATHYVTISPSDNDSEMKELSEIYTVLVRNETYAIIDLTRKRETLDMGQ